MTESIPVPDDPFHAYRVKWEADSRGLSGSNLQEVLNEIEIYKDGHRKKKNREHGYAERLSELSQNLEHFFSAMKSVPSTHVSIATEMIWGGIRFAIQAVIEYPTYFDKILETLETISRDLNLYHKYTTPAYQYSRPAMEILANVYDDIFSVLFLVRQTFFNSKNQKRRGLDLALLATDSYLIPLRTITANFTSRRAILEAERNARPSAELGAIAGPSQAMFNGDPDPSPRPMVENPSLAPLAVSNFNSGNIISSTVSDSLNDMSVHHHLEGDVHHHHYPPLSNTSQERLKQLRDMLRFEDLNCRTKHLDCLEKVSAVTESGKWLLRREEYLSWTTPAAGASQCGLFWLYGEPGVGKTILASIVIEDLKSRQLANTAIGFFYCDYNNVNKNQPNYILRSLLDQLLSVLTPPLSLPINEVLQNFSDSSVPSAKDLLDLICTLSEEYADVYLVIDALDECQNRKGLLPLLQKLSRYTHLFVTSRMERDLQDKFIPPYLKHRVAVTTIENNEDIECYVETVLQDRIEQDVSFIVDDNLMDEIIDTLVTNANGMFLWVYFQLENILLCASDDQIRKTLEDLPDGLEETFIRSLKQINALPKSVRKYVKRMLRWVILFDEIPVDALMELIAVEDMEDSWDKSRLINDAHTMISHCAHLLCIVGAGERVPAVIRPTHFSVYTFLSSDPTSLKNQVPDLADYHVFPQHARNYADQSLTIFRRYFSIVPESEINSVLVGLAAAKTIELREGTHFVDLELWSALFIAPRIEAPQITTDKRIFPHVTTVFAQHCTFYDCMFYYGISFGPDATRVLDHINHFRVIFPAVKTLVATRCTFFSDFTNQPCRTPIVNIKKTVSPHASMSLDSSDPSVVRVQGYTYVSAREDSWNLGISLGVYRNETLMKRGNNSSLEGTFLIADGIDINLYQTREHAYIVID